MSFKEVLITPALLETTAEQLADGLALFEGATPWVHVDISDGVFATPATSCTPAFVQSIGGSQKIEVHLMVQEPEKVFRAWAAVADRVIIHAEASEHVRDILDLAVNLSNGVGLALKLETPLEVLDGYEHLTHVHLMSIAEIGAQGHALDESIFNKVSALRKKIPSVTISVDGGITLAHVKKLQESGANILVVGSAIMRNPNPLEALRAFQNYSVGSSSV